MRVLELYCGIGGCATALQGTRATVAAAVDINQRALDVYRQNFSHPVFTRSLEGLGADWFRQWSADLWWLSPPCQPYTSRGKKRDLADPRAASFVALADIIRTVRPPRLILENVPGFEHSQTHRLLQQTLSTVGYGVNRWLVCPTELGVPNLRRRFYLVASRDHSELGAPSIEGNPVRLQQVLKPTATTELSVDPATVNRYAGALHLVRAEDPKAITACFTAAYGRSLVRSGSYLRCGPSVRRFSPREILRLLGFPDSFRLPANMPAKRAWPLIGNSLSIPAVRSVMSSFADSDICSLKSEI